MIARSIERHWRIGRLTRDDLRSLARLNVCGMTICVFVAIVFSAAMFWHEEPRLLARGIVSGVVLTLILAVPNFALLSLHVLRLRVANRELLSAAGQDSLTLLLNRGAFGEAVETRLHAMRDCPITRGAFFVIDADHFKAINDRWGHSVGDRALVLIAAEMRKVAHRADLVGRLGGEEFGVFLEGAGPTSASETAERLRARVAAIELRSDEGETVRLSVSIGAVYFCQVASFAALYRLADRKLYEAKANGRNRVEFEELRVGDMVELAA
ncbi:GGDEF domain-containing protein [Aureimonas endophytica]|uniref:diguanylate cyclase n=1 Tax=Aureimonas endophytica TaxID=2027858 RepID=A0A916ZCK9_9HYPH|nr:GGDEF domain-containing protein [Aureimonas endophytica]GGD86771.1 GGDEF domain-containing protein [Aureimonas endophytica]